MDWRSFRSHRQMDLRRTDGADQVHWPVTQSFSRDLGKKYEIVTTCHKIQVSVCSRATNPCNIVVQSQYIYIYDNITVQCHRTQYNIINLTIVLQYVTIVES